MNKLMRRNLMSVLALVLMVGTVGAMDTGSLGMLHGTIRCAVLLGVAWWGTMR